MVVVADRIIAQRVKDRGATRPTVCFVAPNAYGALADVDNGHIGGVERQLVLASKWLSRRGYRVSMVTWDEGQPDAEVVAGVTVYKLCRRDAGIRGLRFVHPRWTSFWSALRRADADIYYYNLGDMGLGQIVAWCRRNERKCVYAVASNPDCDPALPQLKPRRERILFRYGLRHADRIIAQTKMQHRMLRDGFGLDSVVIPYFAERPASLLHPRDTNRVLWIGRLSPEKRLEWLFDLAEACPELCFDVVGGANQSSAYASGLMRRAAEIPNVVLHGRVPWRQAQTFYDRCTVLCCTSSFEGFPNTFLEAWSRGVPVVSTFDPDDLIQTKELGVAAAEIPHLASALRRLCNEPAMWNRVSRNSVRYFEEHHSPDAVIPRLERILHDLAAVADR